ncbi:MAG: hypothetical protein ACI8RP_000570 [Urechidicola sp.]|jgi:hypothetical protein
MARELAGIYDAKEESKVSEAMVFLDFDDVIFDSAKEAYVIAMLTSQKIKNLNQLDLESVHARRFLGQRYLIGPAWNYYYLLDAIEQNREHLFFGQFTRRSG